MPPMRRTRAILSIILVLSLALLVHATARDNTVDPAAGDHKPTSPATAAPAAPAAPGEATAPRRADAAKPPPAPPRPLPPLPQPAAEMREAILTAVHAGSIEELRIPLEWNEMKPDLGPDRVDDPVAYWKQLSGDGEGREILAVLGRILEMRYAIEPLGKDFENNRIFVWPYLATADLSKLTPAEEVDLYRLVSPAEAKAMREKMTWTWWRLSIGADGTWHSFVKAGR